MQFLTYLTLAASASTAVVAAPSSGPAKVGSIVAHAKAQGIDIDGAIPSDAVKVAEGHFTAAPGSKAWTWIRAQIDQTALNEVNNVTSVEKRDYANIGIGMFAQDWCNGQAAWFDNVQYGVNSYTATNMYSVGISYRGMRNDEQLDFSRKAGNDFCGNYRYSAGRNTGTGCFNSQLINCFRLTNGH